MSHDKNKKTKIIATVLLSPLIVYLFFLIIRMLRSISPENILSLMPENKFLSFLLIMMLYAFKSITVFFPIVALNIAVGVIYPYKYSFLINLLGSAVAVSVPYIIGTICNKKWADKIVKKYPKINKIEEYRCENQVIFTYLTRAVGFLPCDILSWYMGNRHMNYFQYLFGSILGMLPAMILNTIFGEKLKDGFSIQIIILAIILFAVSFIISYFSNSAMKKLENK